MNDNTIPQNEIQLAGHHAILLKNELKLSSAIIKSRRYESVMDSKNLKQLGLSQVLGQGLLIPLNTPDGLSGQIVYRPDEPKEIKLKKAKPNGASQRRTEKYAFPKKQKAFLDCPLVCQEHIKNRSVPLWITDDPIKADVLATQGLCVIAIVGIWDYTGKKNREEIVRLSDWDHIELIGRPIRILFDLEVLSDLQANRILQRLTEHLVHKSPKTKPINLSKLLDGQISTISDWFALGHTVEELEIESELDKPTLASKSVEYTIVEEASEVLECPLELIDDHAYAATWVNVKETIREEMDESGNLVTLDPPKIKITNKLTIIRDDGAAFGGSIPIDQIGFEIHLREPLRPGMGWNGKGVNKFLSGKRSSPKETYDQLISVFNQFIDFHKSLADQNTMCEFVSCFVLSTWFLDSFNVIGYLWINGERGSGKTNLLILISQLSYLGFFISPSGSFASLRDMADYRATLACDDAENITDPRKTDPDKMALLLAGNRKGLTVPLKEMGSDKAWHTRYVNAYSARAFSAIRVPDSTLASRCIIVPMLRTSNSDKGNIDPLDFDHWPHNRSDLIDDLWALALSNLPKMNSFDKWVAKNTKLVGRNFQPWRGLLAIAKWLDESGAQGLYQRMERLSMDYQKERPELEIADTTRIVIQALCVCAISAIKANSSIKNTGQVILSVAEITEMEKKIIEEEELDIEPSNINNRKTGRLLSKLRFPAVPRMGGKGSRSRVIDLKDLADLAESYKVEFNIQDLCLEISLPANGTDGINGINGTEEHLQDEYLENLSLFDEPEVNCAFCGFSSFWQRSDGGWVCGTCHPNPNNH